MKVLEKVLEINIGISVGTLYGFWNIEIILELIEGPGTVLEFSHLFLVQSHFICAMIIWFILSHICTLMFMISNHYGTKCLIILIELKPCNDIFKVISGIMANWYELINTFSYNN